MAELMSNPRVKEKAQKEVHRVLSGQDKVHQASLGGLHYLKAVIKEGKEGAKGKWNFWSKST